MSYNKRVTYKIRSARGPLIKDCEKGLKKGSNGGVLGIFGRLEFFGGKFREGVHT
jgi:hypothetical protein